MSKFSKNIGYDQLGQLHQLYPGKKITHCHGVFDLFHYGHLLHLQEAKKQGDVLVVTVTPDKYVNKGPHHPHHTEQKRLALLSHLEIIDHVTLNQSATAIEAIQLLKPDFYVKGPDYKDASSDEAEDINREKEAVESVGGQLIYTSGFQDSSSQILNRYFSPWSEIQQQAITQLKKKVSVNDALAALDACIGLKVLVVGEPIIDSYVFCYPVGISSKSSTVSAQFTDQEDYAGGCLAVANQLAALGCDTTLLLASKQEPDFIALLDKSLLPTVNVVHYHTPDIATPKKTRYLTKIEANRMFELIDVASSYWEDLSSDEFSKKFLQLSEKNDVVIATDFGHGLFERGVLKAFQKVKTFLALNVQTNSGNFGFNPFTKHSHYDYLCLDIPELRVATHDRLSNDVELADNVVMNQIKKTASVTMGNNGAIYYPNGTDKISSPAYFKRTLDATGAGDTYFALTALLIKQNVKSEIIPFLGNCIAGLHTQTMGNKHPVNKDNLIRLVKSVLA